jgi:autotransporter-associated beta strand protein
MKTQITICPATARLLFKVCSTLLISFIVLEPASPVRAQTGVYTLNGGTASLVGITNSTSTADQSGIFVYNSGNLSVGTVKITTSGNASNADKAGKYGVNAGVLAGTSTSQGTVLISGNSNQIVTSGSVANGLFATYSGSSITMLGGRISCTGFNAHGVDVTFGGSIILSNVDVTTWGANSSALATDFGGGTVKVYGGTIIASNTTAGSHSAGIYSTGSITVNDANVTSVADSGGVIDGANSITLTNTTLQGALEGITMWKTAPASGNATVTIKGGSVTARGGNVFYLNGNTGNAAAGTLNVLGGAVLSASTSNLIKVDRSSTAAFTATEETLTGNFVTDSTSTINALLRTNTTLIGAVNAAATGTDRLTIDSTSTWNVTSNSTLTSLTNAGTINGPGTVTATTLILQGGAINAVLAGTAGLTKITASNATLSATNTYTGATTVSNGTLFVNGRIAASTVNVWGGILAGTGSLAGAVNIRSGATVSPGVNDIGTLTVSNALMLYGGSTVTMEVNKTAGVCDVLNVTGPLTFAGSLRVTNLAGTLAAGDSFQLFQAGSFSGGFTNVSLPALSDGLAWNTDALPTDGTISVISIMPVFNAPVLSEGTNLIFSGTIVGTNETYYVLASTNIAAPTAQWTRLATNLITGGQFRFTNAIDPSVPQTFYRVQLP